MGQARLISKLKKVICPAHSEDNNEQSINKVHYVVFQAKMSHPTCLAPKKVEIEQKQERNSNFFL